MRIYSYTTGITCDGRHVAKQTHISVLVDSELMAHVRDAASKNAISASAIVREALRQYFGAGHSSIDNGWREGYAAAVSAVKSEINRAISRVSPFAPDQRAGGS